MKPRLLWVVGIAAACGDSTVIAGASTTGTGGDGTSTSSSGFEASSRGGTEAPPEATTSSSTSGSTEDGGGLETTGDESSSSGGVEPGCNNGQIDPGETCDPSVAGSCPEACDDGDPCTEDILVDAGTCTAECVEGTRDLCDLACGDGVVQAWEVCDTAIAVGEDGACPLACDGGDPCSVDVLENEGTCQAACDTVPIVEAEDGDGCCLPGTNPATDDDCPDTCGNGEVERWETCDIAAVGEGACPSNADCEDDDPCTSDALVDAGTCVSECSNDDITEPIAADGCCPPGEDSLTDADCDPVPQCEVADVSIDSSSEPTMALTAAHDHAGVLWALWHTDEGIFNDVRAARLDPETGTWTPDVGVQATSDGFRGLAAATDHAGALWATWVEDGDIADDVRGARLDPGTGTWQADVPIGTTFDEAREPVAVADHEGALWALWLEDGDIADDVRGARLDPMSNTWQPDVAVGTTFDEAVHLTAAPDDQGRLWAAWVEAGGIAEDVRAARLDPGTVTWEPSLILGTSFDVLADLTLVRDDDGTLWAVWISIDGTSDIRGARLDPGTGAWQQDVSIGFDFDPAHDLQVARDHAGALWVFWATDGGIADDVRGARLDPGTGLWDPAVTVSATFDDVTGLAAGQGDDGALWVLRADAGSFDGVRASRLDPESGSWSSEVSVENASNAVYDVAAASDPDGNLWALWMEVGGFGGSSVRATTCAFQ